MNLRKGLIWLGIIVVGLPAGYFGRGYFHQPVNRAQSVVDLFVAYCVPFSQRDIRVPKKPLIVAQKLGEFAWVEPSSVMLLRYSDLSCSVSDVLQPMDAAERDDMDTRVSGLIKREMPELTPYSNHGLDSWAAFLVWESHPRNDKRRRGVVYSRVSSEEESETSLSFSYPINDDVSENLRELRKGS